MRILIGTDAAAPQISGVVTTLNAVEEQLIKKGHTVKLIEPSMFFTTPIPGYPYVPLSYPTGIREMIEDFQPDVVHSYTEGPIGFLTGRACRKMGIPYTTSYATHFAELIEQRYRFPAKLSWKFIKWHHNKAVRTMVATEALANEIKEYGIERAVVWGKGVDRELFNSSHRGTINLLYEQPIWLSVGRVSMEKNLEDFFKLDLPGTKVCIGRGPELDKYAEQYPDVKFLGPLSGVPLAQWYANADVFVFPSRWDTFGLVMVESAACGTPVAAYPVRGPLQAVENGVTGILHRDLKTACLQALAINRDNAEKHIDNYYNWETVVNKLVNHFELIK